MTLTDFLLARIAEDEAAARTAAGQYRSADWHLGEYDETVLMYPPSRPEKIAAVREKFGQELADEHARWSGQTIETAGDEVAPHIVRHDPARVLAECEAKRRIVEQVDEGRRYDIDCGEGHGSNFDHIERLLALPYADHPDYREEWKP